MMMRRHRVAIDEARRAGKGVIDDEVLAAVAEAQPNESTADEGGQQGGQPDDSATRIAELERQLAERDRQVVKLERDLKTAGGKIAKLEKAKATPARKAAEKPAAPAPAPGAESPEQPETPAQIAAHGAGPETPAAGE